MTAQNSSIFNFQEEEYENPASVKSNHGEQEMQEGETIEEFEDRVLNKRAAHLNTILKYGLKTLRAYQRDAVLLHVKPLFF